MKSILKKLNVVSQCRQYKLPLWQCPQFFFLLTGLLTIVIILAGYAIGTKFIASPLVVTWMVMGIALVLLIINWALTRSFEKVAEANRMKSDFIRIVSHQLRSPLSNIKWATEFLMSKKSEKGEIYQQRYFTIIEENIHRMQELISKLLIVSRIEAGTFPLNIELFSLQSLTEGLIAKFSPLAEASNIEILFKTEDNLPRALGDISQIEVVVENLLDNAIRYTKIAKREGKKKGKIEIRISRKGNHLCFKIGDNGVGISRLDQKYIFQKFFRGKESLKYQARGSGLGLYISRSIIKESGGKMGFESEPGEGSTFWFTLPIK